MMVFALSPVIVMVSSSPPPYDVGEMRSESRPHRHSQHVPSIDFLSATGRGETFEVFNDGNQCLKARDPHPSRRFDSSLDLFGRVSAAPKGFQGFPSARPSELSTGLANRGGGLMIL